MEDHIFGVATTIDDGRTVVAVRGELDASTAERLDEALQAAIAGTGAALIIDLADVTFIDSTALGVLVKARTAALAGEGDISLRGISDRVRRILQITSLDQVFTIE